MSKKRGVRTHMETQHVKGNTAKIFTAVVFLYFFNLKEPQFEKCFFLVVCEICRVFVDVWTRNDKYSLSAKVSVYRNQFK